MRVLQAEEALRAASHAHGVVNSKLRRTSRKVVKKALPAKIKAGGFNTIENRDSAVAQLSKPIDPTGATTF